MTKPLPRILILGQFPPSSGGVCTNLQNLLSSPLSENYRLVIFPTGSRKYGKAGYLKETVGQKVLRVAGASFRYILKLATDRPEAVHINTSIANFSLSRDLFFLGLTKLFGIKVLLQIHGGRLDEFLKRRSSLSKLVILRILGLADKTAVLSSIQKRAFERSAGRDKIIIVPNVVDANKFHRNLPGKGYDNSPGERVVILFVAPIFYKNKGVWEILEAIPKIVPNHENVRFVFVGADQEESAMRRHSRLHKLEGYVEFAGRRYGRALVDVYRNADIFLLPSHQEGFPLTILEAMATGLPVVATPVGAIPEIIENGVNGYLIPPRNSQDLAEKIITLIQDKTLRAAMSRNNIKKIKEKYDLRVGAEVFDAIYRGLIRERIHSRILA